MRHARFLLPVVLAALLTACGGAGNAITITVPLKPSHESGLSGVARVAPAGDGSRLTIELDSGTPPPGLTAAVYRGPCRQLPARPVSERVPVDGDAVSLHASETPRELADHSVALKRTGHVLACGDLPAGATA